MFLRRYGTVEAFKRRPFKFAWKLLNYALEEERREMCFRLYLVDRHKMKEMLSFEDYYNLYLPSQDIDNRPKDEIMRELGFIK